MGLDTSHDCWHGPYSDFHLWRSKLAETVGIPYDLMEGFWPSPHDPKLITQALAWAAPREEGPRCGSPYGPLLHGYIYDMNRWLPIKWASLRPDILHVLLDHSDCDGIIAAADCEPLANRLEELLPLLPDEDGGGHIHDWRQRTRQFIEGLRRASEEGEDVVFG